MRYDNRGSFSNHVLATRLRDMLQWQEYDVDHELRARAREIVEAAQAGLPTANEAQTENEV